MWRMGMSEWLTERLVDLCELIADCPHSTPKWTESGVLVLRSQNIRGGRLDLSKQSYTDEAHFEQRSRRAKLTAGDLVITREAPMGEVCIVPDGLRCCLGQRMVMLRPDSRKCDSRFLLYAIQSPAVQHEIKISEGTGSTVSNLRIPLLEALAISHPPLKEQKVIAGILGTLDDKIELNRSINETLEAMARAIFQSWFVDFDPVRAKAGDESTAAICQRLGLTPELLALFPDSFVDSELGEIPKGWKTASLSEIAEVIMGQSPSGDTYNELGEGMPLINGPVEFGAFHPLKRKWTTNPIRVSEQGDLIVCVRGSTTGRHVKSDGIYCLGRGVASIRSRSGNQPYVDQVFQHNLARMLTHATGSTFPSWSGPTLKQWPILLPPPEQLMLAYGEVAASLVKSSDALAHEVNSLVETRDTLLPKLLSGEIALNEKGGV